MSREIPLETVIDHGGILEKSFSSSARNSPQSRETQGDIFAPSVSGSDIQSTTDDDNDIGIFVDDTIQHVIFKRKNKDSDDESDIGISSHLICKSEKFKKGNKISETDLFITNLLKLGEESTKILSETDDKVNTNLIQSKISTPAEEFKYKLKRNPEQPDIFESFIKLATKEFLNLNELRGKLSYIHDYIVEDIPTSESNFNSTLESEYPLSTINGWIWLCAEIIEIFQSSNDVLQDPKIITKCQNFIYHQLLSISYQLKTLKDTMITIDKHLQKFKTKFSTIHSIIRCKFSEAISIEVEELRVRFLQESKDRSNEIISILSRSSPTSLCNMERKNEYIGWGIDGLSLKTNNNLLGFILLNVTKTKPTKFFLTLQIFFEGFTNFLTKSIFFIQKSSSLLLIVYPLENSVAGLEKNNILKLLNICNTLGYLYPMEQTRGIQTIWQIEQVVQESCEIVTHIRNHLEISNQIWENVFGKKKIKLNNIKISFQPFIEWKLSRGLTFQLNLGKPDLQKKSGHLSLLVPNKCSNNTPLYFQIFENNFCAMVDFKEEYKHRTECLRKTGKILEQDVLVCSDTIQHIYYNTTSMIEEIKGISQRLKFANQKLTQTIQVTGGPKMNHFHTLNIWLFICTESLLSINCTNYDTSASGEKKEFLLDFENCFHFVDQWIVLIKTLDKKYKEQLNELQKLQNIFEEINGENGIYFLEKNQFDTDFKQNDNFQDLLTNVNQEISVTLDYNALYIEYSGCNYNLRLFEGPYIYKIIKLFMNHTKEILSSAIDIYSESIELINSSKISTRKIDGQKEIKTIAGIRILIQEIKEVIENKLNWNSLEGLIGLISLDILETEFSNLLLPLQSILSIKKVLKQNLQYPLSVLNVNLGKIWRPGKIHIYNSIADYICGTITIPIFEKPLFGELKHILRNFEDLIDKPLGSNNTDKNNVPYLPLCTSSSVLNPQNLKLVNLEKEFEKSIFNQLNRLKISLQKTTAVFPSSTIKFTQNSSQKYSSIVKPYFIFVVTMFITISIQQSQPKWTSIPWKNESEKIYKMLKKLEKQISYCLESITRLNGRVIKANSYFTTITTLEIPVTCPSHESHDSTRNMEFIKKVDEQLVVHCKTFENKSLFQNFSTPGNLFLSFEVGENGSSSSSVGQLFLNFVGYEKKTEIHELEPNVQINIIQTLITSLKITLEKQSKNIQKLRKQKKVFKSLDKLIPFLVMPQESLEIQNLHLSIDMTKINLHCLENVLQKTKSTLNHCLNIFETSFVDGQKMNKDMLELIPLEILMEEIKSFPIEILVSTNNV